MTAGASPAAKAATGAAWQPASPAAAVSRHVLAEPGQAAERSSGARSPRATTRAASRVRGPGPVTVQRCGGHPCPPEGCHLPVLQELRAAEDAHGPQAPSLVRQVLATPGSGMDTSTRALMEARFGHDFGTVRVHTGARADDSAKAIGARAYTVGDHIVFSAGSYASATRAGQLTLAHELAHVVQQRHGPVDGTAVGGGLRISHPADRFEQEADHVARRMTGTLPMGPAAVGQVAPDQTSYQRAAIGRGAPALVVQRNPEDYQKGYNDGSACRDVHPGPLLPSGLDDYQRGYSEGTEKCTFEPVHCVTQYKKAETFQELIELVRAAESKLPAAGISTTRDQIHALRGIYYGTTWSHDFAGPEKSVTRNEGFQRFTRPSMAPAASVPSDIRSALDCHLFEALQDSQDMDHDPSGRQVDFGHLIIGLDARFDPAFSSNISFPYKLPIGSYDIPMGGTGPELVTWLGDLGGAAASLAIRRVSNASESASTVFTGSDYGGSINLEGDVAAYMVATASKSTLTMPDIKPGKRLSDALADFLLPGATGTVWRDRASTFLSMNGGTFDASGALTNRAALIDAFASKTQTFACNYLASRVKDKHITLAIAKSAGTYVVGTSREVAAKFIDALEDSRKSGSKIEAKNFPPATPAGSQACTLLLNAAALGGIVGL